MKRDRFFGTGLLVIKNVGDMGDKLNKNSQPARTLKKQQKNSQVERLLAAGKQDEVINLLRNSQRFEMKFDTVRPPTQTYYERMIDIFLSDPDNRFSAMVVDKQNPQFDINGIEDTWETYTKYAAKLLAKEMKNLPQDKLCIIVDEISRPRTKPLSLEDTLLSKLRNEISNDPSIDFDNVFGALSIESHSNFLMQLSDLLIGAVMYDFKEKFHMNTAKTQAKKEGLVLKIRNTLGVPSLADSFTSNSTSSYFSVSECI